MHHASSLYLAQLVFRPQHSEIAGASPIEVSQPQHDSLQTTVGLKCKLPFTHYSSSQEARNQPLQRWRRVEMLADHGLCMRSEWLATHIP